MAATPLEADEYLRRPFEASKEQRPSLSDQGQVSHVSRRRLRSPAAPIPVSTPDVLSDAYNQDSPTRRNTDQIALRTQWEGNDITVTAITAYRDFDLFEDADVETSDQHPIFARHSYPARNAFRTYAVVV